jgi:hypothetical protein
MAGRQTCHVLYAVCCTLCAVCALHPDATRLNANANAVKDTMLKMPPKKRSHTHAHTHRRHTRQLSVRLARVQNLPRLVGRYCSNDEWPI